MSIDTLQALFAAAVYNTRLDTDGDLVVESADRRHFISIEENSKRISFLTVFKADPQVHRNALLEATNDFNRQYVVARAYVLPPRSDGNTGVLIDSDLDYVGGLNPLNLLTRFRSFENIVRGRHPLAGLIS